MLAPILRLFIVCHTAPCHTLSIAFFKSVYEVAVSVAVDVAVSVAVSVAVDVAVSVADDVSVLFASNSQIGNNKIK